MSQIIKELFREERNVLERAQSESQKTAHEGNELLSIYRNLTEKYAKLLRQSEKMLRISDKNQALLKTIQNNLECLLDNAGQGFFTFGPELLVDPEYSLECIRIFGCDIAGKNSLQLLFAHNANEVERDAFPKIFEDIFRCVFEDEEGKQDVYLTLLPEEII